MEASEGWCGSSVERALWLVRTGGKWWEGDVVVLWRRFLPQFVEQIALARLEDLGLLLRRIRRRRIRRRLVRRRPQRRLVQGTFSPVRRSNLLRTVPSVKSKTPY